MFSSKKKKEEEDLKKQQEAISKLTMGKRLLGSRKMHLLNLVQEQLNRLAKKRMNSKEVLKFISKDKKEMKKYYSLARLQYMPTKYLTGVIGELAQF